MTRLSSVTNVTSVSVATATPRVIPLRDQANRPRRRRFAMPRVW
ncbi:hypothetical protein L915_18038 [Phytophthora nicotianae]|uniref:Uncharacterized protein n=1 Tax=Phytophthora nicotianae TaxID=4792 RepID=W2FX54_PHYNI|nr:hypothetical protein L915_18038 [Phytophthora nicotianae]